MVYDLANQRVVVTGITGGIARATTEMLLSLGSEVIVTARDHEKLEQSLADLSGKVSGAVLDLTDETSIKDFFAKTGKFDHLVTPAATGMFGPIKDIDLDAAKMLFETKQWGQLLSVHHALPYLRKDGSITLFSGTVTQKPIAGASMYASVGAATEAAGRVWAHELAPLRVNTVVPGIIDTKLWGGVFGDDAVAREAVDNFAGILPVGRVGTAEDVAKSVAFLIDNTFVNGISLVVDGGHRLI